MPSPKDYDDIISLRRPQSKYAQMSHKSRAAQFAPFAALSGYQDLIHLAEENQKYYSTENVNFDPETNISDNNDVIF